MELLALGLGNPGERYSRTRHNAGFLVADRISEKLGISLRKPWFQPYLFGKGEYRGVRIFVAKPLTFMNRSGEAAPAILGRAGLSLAGLVVVCDTMDLPAGALRLKMRGGSAGHNGLKSLIAGLGTEDFMRLYVGIGRPEPGRGVVSHVLGEPGREEWEALDKAVGRAAEGILSLLEAPPEGVMNEINKS